MWPLSRDTRDTLAYALGGAGFLHELFISQGERPFLLTASLALMGFPLVLKGEEKLQQKRQEKLEEDDKGE